MLAGMFLQLLPTIASFPKLAASRLDKPKHQPLTFFITMAPPALFLKYMITSFPSTVTSKSDQTPIWLIHALRNQILYFLFEKIELYTCLLSKHVKKLLS
jgi:hypothetical protein